MIGFDGRPGTAVLPAAILPILLFPSSRMMWTAIDLIMRPLDPGEIDPRFIRDEGGWRNR